MKYYYVILGTPYDYFDEAYRDINYSDDGDYISSQLNTKNAILCNLYKIHISSKANKYFSIPGKGFWNSFLCPKVNVNKRICFVFFAGALRLLNVKNGLITYLKKKYSDSKYVCFYQDLVSNKRPLSIEEVKKVFDLVISYDQGDCNKYGLVYHSDVYSSPRNLEYEISNDVYFVGRAKNRLNELLKSFSYFKDNGLKCDFHIIDAPDNLKKYSDEIHYEKFVPYIDNVINVAKTKSILELMQDKCNGFTLRTCEAIAYNKLLITNNQSIVNSSIYSPGNIFVFQNIDSIAPQSIISSKPFFSQAIRDQISPINFLRFIDNLL